MWSPISYFVSAQRGIPAHIWVTLTALLWREKSIVPRMSIVRYWKPNSRETWRMPYFGMLRCVADVSEECIASIIRMKEISNLRTSAVTSNYCLLLTFRARRFLLHWWWRWHAPQKRRFLQEQHGDTSQNTTFFSHRRENLKSYIALTGWAL
jgi:hypothetical protein